MQVASPAISKTSADAAEQHQLIYETQIKAFLLLVPCNGMTGFKRGVDEETAEKLVQCIIAEKCAKLASDSDEEVSLMFRSAIEEVKKLAKQVIC